MQRLDSGWVYSPSDLCIFWESPFASWMDRFVKECPDAEAKRDEDDVLSKALQRRGDLHERHFLDEFKASGLNVVEIEKSWDAAKSLEQTVAAMRAGAAVIYQGRLTKDQFSGLADFLIRVPEPSRLGDYSYEVLDTKLSSKIKPYFLIQLCAYADCLQEIQGSLPESVAIVLGNGERRRFRTVDYFSYYRSLKAAFSEFQAKFDPKSMPDPGRYRNFRHWSDYAAGLLKANDSLYQTSRISKNQVKNLEAAGIHTMTQLANSALARVPKLKEEVFSRLRQQAALQVRSRDCVVPMIEVLPHQPEKRSGLCAVPPHSESDVFFDMEGFPLFEGGLEYLWGATYLKEAKPDYRAFWAHSREEEQTAFEAFIDWVFALWRKDPTMHIYHYANYEIAAIRRMMGRFSSRENEVDQLLRHEVFVDLYAIVKNGLRIGASSYSIKTVELLYRDKRSGNVKDGGASVIFYEMWQQNNDQAVLDSLRDYNKDDCDSTYELTVWLRDLQKKHALAFVAKERPISEAEEAAEASQLQTLLLAKSGSCPELKTTAWLVDFHRREQKPQWWRFFDRLKMSEDELNEDIDCLAGLIHSGKEPIKVAKSLVHEYTFDPVQECKLAPTKNCRPTFNSKLNFVIHDIDIIRGICQFKVNAKTAMPDRMDIIPYEIVGQKVLIEGVSRYAEARLAGGTASRAVDDFLARRRPRIRGSEQGPIIAPGVNIMDAAIQAVMNLEESSLSIQGPPGAGKSYTATQIILALVEAGKRIGITSNSHKAINNLLISAFKRIREAGLSCRVVKIGGDEDDPIFATGVEFCKGASALKISDDLLVIGGTAFAVAHEAMVGQLDYLFVDEAGQVSIANLVAMGASTRNIVMMGDQMQLGQPVQGSHRGESGLSLLDYLLQGQATIPDDMGIFLPHTYRLHPGICKFISEMVYEGRLDPAPGNERQRIVCPPGAPGAIAAESGLVFVPVAHEGNTQASEEEIAKILEIVTSLIGRTYIDKKGEERALVLNEILFVAPYNFQVRKLKAALGSAAQVGSVDKFQGQEAPVVIMSMCASSMEDGSGRGIEFVFSKNRLNVAITRAQVLAIVVGNPALAHTHVATVEQMAQVNFFCRLVEFAV